MQSLWPQVQIQAQISTLVQSHHIPSLIAHTRGLDHNCCNNHIQLPLCEEMYASGFNSTVEAFRGMSKRVLVRCTGWVPAANYPSNPEVSKPIQTDDCKSRSSEIYASMSEPHWAGYMWVNLVGLNNGPSDSHWKKNLESLSEPGGTECSIFVQVNKPGHSKWIWVRVSLAE